MNTPIFLIGYMGSGKTTVGKKLARRLHIPFIDIDEELTQAVGMSIPAYFEKFGEAQFRELERAQLKQYAHVHAIVSTGGGAPCFFDNMEWMNQHGLSVYLEHSPKSLWSRLVKTDTSSRPILAGKSEEELFAFITEKLAERAPFYEQAHIRINQIHAKVDDIAVLIEEKIKTINPI